MEKFFVLFFLIPEKKYLNNTVWKRKSMNKRWRYERDTKAILSDKSTKERNKNKWINLIWLDFMEY